MHMNFAENQFTRPQVKLSIIDTITLKKALRTGERVGTTSILGSLGKCRSSIWCSWTKSKFTYSKDQYIYDGIRFFTLDYEIRGGDRLISGTAVGFDSASADENITITGNVATQISVRCKSIGFGQQVKIVAS